MFLFVVNVILTLGSLFIFYSNLKIIGDKEKNTKIIENNILVFFILTVLFGILSFVFYPNSDKNKREEEYQIFYNQCHEKYSANDTMRNTALFVVQLQFKRMDKLSLAPTESYQAINILCDIQAKESVEKRHKDK